MMAMEKKEPSAKALPMQKILEGQGRVKTEYKIKSKAATGETYMEWFLELIRSHFINALLPSCCVKYRSHFSRA